LPRRACTHTRVGACVCTPAFLIRARMPAWSIYARTYARTRMVYLRTHVCAYAYVLLYAYARDTRSARFNFPNGQLKLAPLVALLASLGILNLSCRERTRLPRFAQTRASARKGAGPPLPSVNIAGNRIKRFPARESIERVPGRFN